MELQLEEKRVWVLGASSGLGRAAAEAFLQEGARVAISSRPGQALDQARDELDVAAVPLDVAEGSTIAAACHAATDALGGLDIVVSNHGGPPPGGFDDIDGEAFTRGFDLVLGSAFRLTKAVVPHLRASEGGVIAFITSYGTKEIIPGLLLSNTMRAGVVGLMKTLARDLGPDQIRTLCVAPGKFATNRAAAVDEATAKRTGESVEAVRQASEATTAIGRYGQPTEFGEMLAFLCSPRAAYMTGTTVLIDGGKVLALSG